MRTKPTVATPDATAPPVRFFTLSQFAAHYPAFSLPWLRFLRQNQIERGFERAFIKVGKRLFVDEAEFLAAVDVHRERTP